MSEPTQTHSEPKPKLQIEFKTRPNPDTQTLSPDSEMQLKFTKVFNFFFNFTLYVSGVISYKHRSILSILYQTILITNTKIFLTLNKNVLVLLRFSIRILCNN
jgi:hypothetical protein